MIGDSLEMYLIEAQDDTAYIVSDFIPSIGTNWLSMIIYDYSSEIEYISNTDDTMVKSKIVCLNYPFEIKEEIKN
jgi:hypothetical protein